MTKANANQNTVTTVSDRLDRVKTATPDVTYCYDGNTQSPCTNALKNILRNS
jgi:hypothetical protein